MTGRHLSGLGKHPPGPRWVHISTPLREATPRQTSLKEHPGRSWIRHPARDAMHRRVDLNSRAKRLVQALTPRALNDFADREIRPAKNCRGKLWYTRHATVK